MEFNSNRKEASAHTVALQEKIRNEMNKIYDNQEKEDMDEIKKHFILFSEKRTPDSENGPDTVNPYLWRIASEQKQSGVIKLDKDIYEVYGIESANIAFIRSKNGWIVQDALGSVEGVEMALNLLEKALNEQIRDKIKALIISHTHTDHIGGIGAILKYSPETIIYGPAEYQQSLVDDNLYAGVAMSRRLQYQCGLFLPHDEKGWVSIGLSSNLGVHGHQEEKLPDKLIGSDGIVEIDGVPIYFILTPHTETRAHMSSYFVNSNVLYLGDNSVGTLHNTYTMRGAPVRDANYWGKVFYHLYELFGDEVKAVFQGHGLPIFKTKKNPDYLKKYLLDNAVSYKYTHDQALLLANEGYTINEIGNKFKPREDISRTWYTRGHYGSYSFNARGAYQKYLGFYDGNPVNLLPLSERELAAKLIEYIGSADEIIKKAEVDFDDGQYQWVATITNHLVQNDPKNLKARYLCADAFEQLGYQSENALWRNAYLSAAMELRNPKFALTHNIKAMDNDEVIPFVSVELLLDHLGINFDGEKSKDFDSKFVLNVGNEYHDISIYKGTVLHDRVEKFNIKNANVVTITKDELYQLSVKKYNGNEKVLLDIQEYIVNTSKYQNFNLIEPLADNE